MYYIKYLLKQKHFGINTSSLLQSRFCLFYYLILTVSFSFLCPKKCNQNMSFRLFCFLKNTQIITIGFHILCFCKFLNTMKFFFSVLLKDVTFLTERRAWFSYSGGKRKNEGRKNDRQCCRAICLQPGIG